MTSTWTVDQGTVITAKQKQAVALVNLKAMFANAIQAHLDGFAKSHDYDSIHTGTSYVGDPNPKYNAEGIAMRNWRSAVWTFANAELGKVMSGQRSQPTVEELISELPNIVWPSGE